MDKFAIHAENLSKRYFLGSSSQPTRSFVHAVGRALAQPITNWRRLRRLSTSGAEGGQSNVLWALKDVSFSVKQGEVLGVIGRNGAGKSTLLKILSRITEPTSGWAGVNGRVASLLEVGTGFHDELSGRANIYLNGVILGMKRREVDQRFDRIVEFAGVGKFLDTPVKWYSSGMKMRLAFSVAAFLEPEILLVDEVLSVGDMDFQKRSIGRMQEVTKEGRTVLFVSHNLASVSNLCDQALLLDQGWLVMHGPVAEVVRAYIGGGRSETGTACWPDLNSAPGNDVVRLTSVRVLSPDGVPTSDVDIPSDTSIELRYTNLEDGARIYPGIWLINELGVRVFTSTNHPSISATPDPWSGRPFPKGTYRSICTIPGNFLNDGLYSITVVIGRDSFKAQAFVENAVSFRVHDTGAMRKEYTGSWKEAVVRPKLPWNTEETHAGELRPASM